MAAMRSGVVAVGSLGQLTSKGLLEAASVLALRHWGHSSSPQPLQSLVKAVCSDRNDVFLKRRARTRDGVRLFSSAICHSSSIRVRTRPRRVVLPLTSGKARPGAGPVQSGSYTDRRVEDGAGWPG
ncbi:hypothetical protein MHYP_G00168160 [Metynnis hypsauchen]